MGIEINPYAAELARVTIWIGEIQWMRRNGFDLGRDPILKPLDTIECRDAILNEDGTEAEWPEADVSSATRRFWVTRLRTCQEIIESTFERVKCGFTTRFSYHMLWR